MRRYSAVLIGFPDQENLGLGYLASTLAERGFVAQTLDYRQGRESILEAVRETKPLLVGFSLIFQYFLPQFAQLASYLRDNGVDHHFSVGGHFPSLRYEEVLRTVPELDSIVRCEGEVTLAELMQSLAQGTDWHNVAGIAYRTGSECVATPPRPLIADLDALPFPVRPACNQAILGKNAAPLLASRGCARNCSFCSIRQFYRLTPGKKVRVRSPERVAEEMRVLHEERRISVFLFQDDDFPIWVVWSRWVEQFIQALHDKDLAGRIIWKISCRADEVEVKLFTRMREAGLYMVYLGLESGNASGLRTLNKGLVVEDSLRAVATLKEIGLLVGYGFMLFDPSSTFESVRANVSFLRQITGDGATAALFCRMLPYAGTPIEKCLTEEGRLHGTVVDPGYDFLDARMDEFFDALNEVTAGWIHGPNALANQINWAWQEYWVMRRLFPVEIDLDGYARGLSAIARRSNEYLLRLVEEVAAVFDRGEGKVPSFYEVRADSQGFADQLLSKRNAFVLRNQPRMLSTLEAAA